MIFKGKTQPPAFQQAGPGAPASYTEAYKSLSINLDVRAAEKGCKSIMITSALPQDGKSNVAMNLTRALSEREKKVILIDGDSSSAALTTYFQLNNHVSGLTELLAGKSLLKDVTVQVRGKEFYFIPSGSLSRKSTDLFSKSKVEQVMEELKERYDYIIFDAPPVTATADVLDLSRAADGVLFVVRDHGASKQAVNECIKQLEAVNACVLGSVLTDCEELDVRGKAALRKLWGKSK